MIDEPGGEAVRQLDEAELGRGPQHDLFGQPRQMHGRDGRRGQRLEHEVAVGDGIDGIGHRPGKAQRARRHLPVDGKRRAGQRCRPERALVEARARIGEAPPVARQHLDIGQAVVPEGHRLGHLQVGEARHHGRGMVARLFGQGQLQPGRLAVQPVEAVADVEAEIGGDLVVARARGVQPAGRLADQLLEPAFHRHVDVFQRSRKCDPALRRCRIARSSPRTISAASSAFEMMPRSAPASRHGPWSLRYPGHRGAGRSRSRR
jgi:hypothetical protein